MEDRGRPALLVATKTHPRTWRMFNFVLESVSDHACLLACAGRFTIHVYYTCRPVFCCKVRKISPQAQTSICADKTRTNIAFKLVWCPTESFDSFVLVDDDGKKLAQGKPTGRLPSLRERQVNYKIVAGSKYAIAADKVARGETTSRE